MSSRVPCPCCGHLTLSRGPGDYDWCLVCFWEDDGGQLRYPMSHDGANGVSLVEAQRRYREFGAMHERFRGKVRRPTADEPLDEGWRPFDPAIDWTVAVLDGDTWPVNLDSLYYWRDTYWNGDQHKLPLPPSEPTNADRLLEHLRREVPEVQPEVAEAQRRWGRASPWRICTAAARICAEAYLAGDEELGLRVVRAFAPTLDEASSLYAPHAVKVNLLEHPAWYGDAIEDAYTDRWPPPVRDELRRQQAARREAEEEIERRRDAMTELHRSGRGQAVGTIVGRLRTLLADEFGSPRGELHLQLRARFISDPHWLRHHPLDSAWLAWRFRAVQAPRRTLAWLRRPRFAG